MRVDARLVIILSTTFSGALFQSGCPVWLPLFFRNTIQHDDHSSSTSYRLAGRHTAVDDLSAYRVVFDVSTTITAAAAVISIRNRNVALLRPRLVLVGSARPFAHLA